MYFGMRIDMQFDMLTSFENHVEQGKSVNITVMFHLKGKDIISYKSRVYTGVYVTLSRGYHLNICFKN